MLIFLYSIYKNKGGGFIAGSNGQEESLCRNSGLYPTLCKFKKEYYEFHKLQNESSLLYSNSCIYSPNVPVIRNDNGDLLKESYSCSFISASAVNCKYWIKRHKGNELQWIVDSKNILYQTMKNRIDKILDIAIKNKHDAIILGPFGCGIFDNDANIISDIFASLLSTKYLYRFKKVRFSILEFSRKEKVFDAFDYALKRRFQRK